jgi:hypothetical protein
MPLVFATAILRNPEPSSSRLLSCCRGSFFTAIHDHGRNRNTCTASNTADIKIFTDGLVSIPNSFTPNNGKNDVFYIPGSTLIQLVKDFSVYDRYVSCLHGQYCIQRWKGAIYQRHDYFDPVIIVTNVMPFLRQFCYTMSAVWFHRIFRWLFGLLFVGAGIAFYQDGAWPAIAFGLLMVITGFFRPRRCVDDEDCSV